MTDDNTMQSLDKLLIRLAPQIFGTAAVMQARLARAQKYAAAVRARKGMVVRRVGG